MSNLVGRKPIQLNINDLKDGHIPIYDKNREIWGTINATGSFTSSYALVALTVLQQAFTGSFTGSFFGDGSNLNFTTLNTNQATDSELVVGNIYNNYQNRQKTIFKKGDLEVSGSITISDEGLLILTPRTEPIPAIGGGIFYSASGEFFVGTPL